MKRLAITLFAVLLLAMPAEARFRMGRMIYHGTNPATSGFERVAALVLLGGAGLYYVLKKSGSAR